MKLVELNLEEQALDILFEEVLQAAELTSIRVFSVDYMTRALSEKHFYDQKAAGDRSRTVPEKVFELLKEEDKTLILGEDSIEYSGETYSKLDKDNKCEVYIPLRKTLDAKEYYYGLILLAADKELKEQSILDNQGLHETLKRLNCKLSKNDDIARRKESMVQIAYMLCEIIDGKEPYLISRLFNVAYWGTKIARTMGISEEDVEKLQIAVLMHDLGKIYIDEGILNKKGELTEEEYKIIKKRVVLSFDIAKKLNGLFVINDLPDIILSYQERVDGKGYPNGLKGDEIPLLSKILGTAKAISSMLVNTSYKRAMSIPEVIRERRENSNRQFDRKVVDAAIAVLADEKKESQVVFDNIGIFATLNIIIKNADEAGEVNKAIESIQNEADEAADANETGEINESMNIWGNVRKTDDEYIFTPIEKTANFKEMVFQYLKLYISVNERMFRYIPEIKEISAHRLVFSELKLVEDTNAFALRWLLDGYFVSPTRNAYKIFVTMIGGDFADFYIFSDELNEVFSQGIIRITFEDGKSSTVPGMIIYSEKIGDKTHFRLKFAGLKESEKQMIFSQIFKKQIEIRTMQNEGKKRPE